MAGKLAWFGRLFASRTVESGDIPGIVVLGDVHGDVSQAGASVADPRPIDWQELRAEQREIDWLNWRTELSAFVGREREKAELLAWARQDHSGLLARFITGEGGVGKTRLAAEVARKLERTGWTVGFADLEATMAYRLKARLTLIIIDYPEERRERVRSALRNLGRTCAKHPVRLLLLSRRGWDVWAEEIDRVSGVGPLFDRVQSIFSHSSPKRRSPPLRARAGALRGRKP